jgi:hypothetical protein
MALTQIYPPITISPGGLATEATLASILAGQIVTNEELSKDVLSHFFQDPNTLTGVYQTMWTVAGKALEAITVKQNDGNVISIGVNGVEQIVAPPSGEVQHYPIKAAIGAVIGIKVLGSISNAGPVSIEFLG